VRDVAGSEADFAGHPLIVPDRARALVRAHHSGHGRSQATPGDPFFPLRDTSGLVSGPGGRLNLVARIAKETGLAMPHHDDTTTSRRPLHTTEIAIHAL
jgi:hypothetical protein